MKLKKNKQRKPKAVSLERSRKFIKLQIDKTKEKGDISGYYQG